MASLKPGKPGKQKTKSSAKKRFQKTNGGSGDWVNDKVAHNHLLLQKSKRQKNQASKNQTVAKSNTRAIDRMMAS
jgi:ribosomal protein L35